MYLKDPFQRMAPSSFIVTSSPVGGDSLEQGAKDLKVVLERFTAVNAETVVETFLYAIHCIIFTICCFILVKKRQHTTSLIFLAAAILMFGVSTADFAISLRTLLVDIPKLIQGRMSLNEVVMHRVPKGQLFVTNNFIADLLLLYRCCVVWNFRKSIFAVSALLLLGDTVWGWVGVGTSNAFFVNSWDKYIIAYAWSIFCLNIVMTFLIVGRIWWITKRARPHLAPRELRVYRTVIVIFAETALIYSTCVLIVIVLPKPNPYNSIATVAVVRLVSTMPTLLIVQIASGRPFDDQFKVSASTDKSTGSETTGTTTQDTSGMLDTTITALVSSRNHGESQDVTLDEGSKRNVAGSSV